LESEVYEEGSKKMKDIHAERKRNGILKPVRNKEKQKWREKLLNCKR
jgi:hypothetical protein